MARSKRRPRKWPGVHSQPMGSWRLDRDRNRRHISRLVRRHRPTINLDDREGAGYLFTRPRSRRPYDFWQDLYHDTWYS